MLNRYFQGGLLWNKKNTIIIEFENGDVNFEYCREFFEVNEVPVQKVTREQGHVSYRVDGDELSDRLSELNESMKKIIRAAPSEEERERELEELKKTLRGFEE